MSTRVYSSARHYSRKGATTVGYGDDADGDSGFSDAGAVSPAGSTSSHSGVFNFSSTSTSGCSSTSGSARKPAGKPRTPPICNRCKVHGVKQSLKGHKRYCRFLTCDCSLCELVVEKRVVMADQTKLKRAQDDDEKYDVPIEKRARVVTRKSSATTPLRSPSVPHLDLVSSAYVLPSVHSLVPTKPVPEWGLVEDAYQLLKDFNVRESALALILAVVIRVGGYENASRITLKTQEALLENVRVTMDMMQERPPICVSAQDAMLVNSRQTRLMQDRSKLDLLPERPRLDLTSDRARMDLVPDRPSLDLTSDRARMDLVPDRPRLDLASDRSRMDFVSHRPRMDLGSDIRRLNLVPIRPRIDLQQRPGMDLAEDRPLLNLTEDRPRLDHMHDRTVLGLTDNRPKLDLLQEKQSQDLRQDRPPIFAHGPKYIPSPSARFNHH